MISAARKPLAILLALATLLVVSACGDDGDQPLASSATTGPESASGCAEIEEVEVELAGQHSDQEFTSADFETNPPAGGDHSPTPLEAGRFYPGPQPLGEAVHLLEHGAVIGWTNDLSADEQSEVEDAFNEVFKDGYHQLAVIENPDLEVPFAISAWGALQRCETVDTSVIRPFVEEWYASPRTAEGGLACQGQARSLPNC